MDLVKEIWKDLLEIGFKGSIQTLSEFYSWLRKIRFIHKLPFLKKEQDGSYCTQLVRYSEILPAISGTFGTLYLTYREHPEQNGYVFMKTCPQYPESLLLEGILQSTAHSVLRTYGFPKAVPKILDILHHPEFGIVFTVERSPGTTLFADYLKNKIKWGKSCEENDRIILSVVAQVATYMYILETTIGLNHRDLKSTNVLMIAECVPYNKTVEVDKYKWTIHTNVHAILIDFGFACVGQNGSSIISAGEHLPTIDFCPKEGRDMFMLFANLWNVEAIRESMTHVTRELFRKWLQDKSSTNWADWLVNSTKDNLASMYLLVNADTFKSKKSSPIEVLKDISFIYPNILSFLK